MLLGYLHEVVFGARLCLGHGMNNFGDFLLEFAYEYVEWDSGVWVLLLRCYDDFFNRNMCNKDVLVQRVFIDGSASDDT